MKAYKIIGEHWISNNHKYELNKTYTLDKNIILNKQGFHSCEYLFECYSFYNNKYGNLHVCEVEIDGKIDKSYDRIVSDTITIKKELTQQEIEDTIRKESSLLTATSWILLSSRQKLGERFITEFKDLVSWMEISKSPFISEKFIEQNKDKLNREGICCSRILSEEFILNNMEFISWEYTLSKQKISEKILIEIMDYFISNKENKDYTSAWCVISAEQELSERLIEKYRDYLDFDLISYHQVLSESFILRNFDKLNKDYIVEKQKLSESLIRRYWKELNWSLIPSFQEMSENLISDFADIIEDWFNVFVKQKLSEEFKYRFRDKLNFI